MLKLTLYSLPIFFLYGIRKYLESRWGKCKNKILLNGKVAVVTGANSGIGFEVAKELASRHATVIVACRNMRNANLAIKKIQDDIIDVNTPYAFLIAMELDLASLASINNFVKDFKTRFSTLDILINNAGVSLSQKNGVQRTSDNLELHFGVNYLGHFYLTTLLLDVLKAKPSKIINVSSKLHEKGQINLDDLNSMNQMSKRLYADSKLANIYFSKELSKRTEHSNIEVFAVCPGWVYTNLFRDHIKWYHYILFAPIAFFFMRSARQGAQTIIYCATEPGLQSGIIYRDCKMYESKHKFDPNVSSQLWEKTEEMIKSINRQSD